MANRLESLNLEPNGFQRYPDGDVVISFAANGKKDLILHSDTLARYSNLFKRGPSSDWLEAKTTGTKVADERMITMKWYQLVSDEWDHEGHFLEGKVHQRLWAIH